MTDDANTKNDGLNTQTRLDPEHDALGRFRTEYSATGELNHVNTLRAIAFEPTQEQPPMSASGEPLFVGASEPARPSIDVDGPTTQMPPMDASGALKSPTPLPDPNQIVESLTVARARKFRHQALVPGTVVGDFVIEKELGRGAMGEVYAAKHPLIGKRAAIKVISDKLSSDQDAVERFVNEARAVCAIQHPGIVDIYSFGELEDGRAYYIMEWLTGESLGERLQRERVPCEECVDILDQIARALDVAHKRGVIHRDLKPDNVFLAEIPDEKPVAKILDFGLAKLAQADDVRVRATESGMMMGTPVYISPEQAKGKDVDHRTDIYALGVMAHELLCGQVPFWADNPAELIAMHLHQVPPRASSLWPKIPGKLDHLLSAMIEKDAGRRPTLSEIRGVFRQCSTLPRAETPVPVPVPIRAATSVPISEPSHTVAPVARPGLSLGHWLLGGMVVLLTITVVLIAGSDTETTGIETPEPGGQDVKPESDSANPVKSKSAVESRSGNAAESRPKASVEDSSSSTSRASHAQSHPAAPNAQPALDAGSSQTPPTPVPVASPRHDAGGQQTVDAMSIKPWTDSVQATGEDEKVTVRQDTNSTPKKTKAPEAKPRKRHPKKPVNERDEIFDPFGRRRR